MTKDEMNGIAKAMEHPEFREMMNDYINEISDPNNRDEYD
jgi:hypothetical protein